MRSVIIYIIVLFSLGKVYSQTFSGTANYSANGGHWTGFTAPVPGANVTIGNGICTIISGEDIEIGDLVISTGATLRMQGPASLKVTGTFQNNGTLQATTTACKIEIGGDVSGSGQFDLGNTGTTVFMGGANNNGFTGTVTGITGSKFVYNRVGGQSILKVDYFKLAIAGSGVKQLGTGSPRNINDSLIITPGATFDFQPSIISYGNLHNDGALTTINSYSFFATVDQVISGNGVFNFNTFYVNKTASSSVIHNSPSKLIVNNQLNLNSGIVRLENGDLELASSATLNGTFGATSMIETNAGKFIRQVTSGSQLVMAYPLGTAGEYHPVNISSCNTSGTGGLAIKINAATCTNCVDNFIDLGTTGSLVVSDIAYRMEFLGSDKIGTPNSVFKNLSLVSSPDTNTVSPPYYYGYNGNLAVYGGISGSWRYTSTAPTVDRVERRASPGTAVSSICKNEKIMLVGKNFSALTTFEFVGSAITDFTISATLDTIYINSMPFAGSGNITIANAQGSIDVPFSVQPSPDPAVFYTVPSSVCSGAGMTINITAEPLTNYQVILNGVLSSAQLNSSTGGNLTIPVPGVEMIVAGNYDVIFKMTRGTCVDTSAPPKSVTVFAGPDVTSASFPASVSKCATDISFTPSVSNFDSVTWSTASSGSFSSTTSVNTIYSPSTIDITNASVAIDLTVSKSGCPDLVKSTTVTIIPAPSASLLTGSDTICENGTYVFTINISGTAPFNGLSLTLNPGSPVNIATAMTNTITLPVTTSGTATTIYTLSEQAFFFTDQTGCRGTVTGSHTLDFETIPTASLSFSDTSMCAGGNVLLDLVVSGKFPVDVTISNGSDTYTGTALVASLAIPVSPTASSTFTVTGFSTAHCSAGTGIGSTNVIVKPAVNPNVTLTHIKDTLCEGQTVSFGINTQVGVTYRASLAGTNIGNQVSGTGGTEFISILHSEPALATGSNNIIIKAMGCSTDTLSQNFLLMKSDLVSSFILDTPNGTQLCGAAPVILSTSMTAPFMLWQVDGDDIIDVITNNYSVLVPGTYQLTMKDNYMCLSASNTVAVGYFTSQPVVSTNVISGYETVLNCTGGSGFAWYASVDGGVKKILNETSASYTVYFNGTYFASILQNGCLIFSDPIVISGKVGGSLLRQNLVMSDSTISIPRLNWNDPISVYPNPVMQNDQFTIQFLNTRGASVSAELYSSDGILLRREIAEGQGMINLVVPTGGIKPGLYFLKLDDGLKTVGSNLIIN